MCTEPITATVAVRLNGQRGASHIWRYWTATSASATKTAAPTTWHDSPKMTGVSGEVTGMSITNEQIIIAYDYDPIVLVNNQEKTPMQCNTTTCSSSFNLLAVIHTQNG